MPNQLDRVTKATVDMRISKFDEKTSDLKRGVINWTDKKYINYRATPRPEHWLSWCRYESKDGYRDLHDWAFAGWSPVTFPQDPYFVEGAELTPEGHFVYGDLIRVKRSLRREVEERLENQKNTPTAKSHVGAYTAERKAEGLDVPDEIIETMLRSLE